MTVLVFAPNWLGDAVMALPAIADVRRQAAEPRRIVVAARPAVAGIFTCVPDVDAVLTLDAGMPGGLAGFRDDVRRVTAVGADVALLFPNSIRSALVARQARVSERWGYRHDGRGVLLTRSVRKPRRSVHQVDYYRHLVAALGFAHGPREPRLVVPADARTSAARLLTEQGWKPGTRLLGMAPGAAYGGAKRWPDERFARVSVALARSHGAATVLVGSAADAQTAVAITREAGKIAGTASGPCVINLTGRTDLAQLAGVLAHCAAFLSNDSGAMHVAAAVGTPVAAVFGPTNEHETAPLAARAAILRAPVWCRPCMLRECPLDHRCMTGVSDETVAETLGAMV